MSNKVKRRKKLVNQAMADALGVTRQHLSYVIHGHRESRSLLRRYRALLKEAA
jgi:plasmid maintenance system antidote protein VapI